MCRAVRTIRWSGERGGFSKLRGVRESRVEVLESVGAQAEAGEDQGRSGEGERLAVRGGGGSCFERFHSSMVPDYPSFCYRTKPPSAFTAVKPPPPPPVPPFNPAGVLVLLHLHRLLSAAIRVLVIRRHRPSIFLFDRFFPLAAEPPPPPPMHRPLLHYACAASRA